MRPFPTLLLALLLACSVLPPFTNAAPGLPDTPAARRLGELLERINAGDRDSLKAYALRNFVPGMLQPEPDDIVDFLVTQHTSLGGYDVRRVVQSAPQQITVLVQGRRDTGRWLRLTVGAEPDPPHRVQGFFTFAATAAQAADDGGPVPADSLPGRLARLVDGMAAEGGFSGSVCLARGDQVLLERAWGEADREAHVANRPDTRFGIASVGKMFTAVAVAQLAAEGRLRFDDPASRYVPGWLAPQARTVTIAQLLEHTSGLGDFLGRLNGEGANRRYERLEDYRALAAADTPAFEPGTAFRYSNVGYLVLGAIVQEVSGEPWDRYLESHVFRPAGMRATSAYRPAAKGALAMGYMQDDDGVWSRNEGVLEGRGSPAGGSASTAGDLAAFARALRSGVLLPPALLDSLTEPRVEMAGTGRMYGRGFTVSRGEAPRIWGHAGGFPGVGALVEVYEDRGWVLAVLSNTTDGATPVGDAWRDLLRRSPPGPSR